MKVNNIILALEINNVSVELSKFIPMGYLVLSILAVILLIAFVKMFSPKQHRYALHSFIAVLTINVGYFLISISNNLQSALWGNRLSYIGSVALLTMILVTMLDLCNIKVKKFAYIFIVVIDVLVILLTCSGGSAIKLYYNDVALYSSNGCSILIKEYGPLHNIFLITVLCKFAIILYLVVDVLAKDHLKDSVNPVLLVLTVFINIFIWTFERLASNSFEYLSISYVISEVLLIVMFKNKEAYDSLQKQVTNTSRTIQTIDDVVNDWQQRYNLTNRESEILNLLLNNLRRLEIAESLSITEHTVKKHTGHIYEKLNVSSRNELLYKFNEEITN